MRSGYSRNLSWIDRSTTCRSKSRCELVTASELKRYCVRVTEGGTFKSSRGVSLAMPISALAAPYPEKIREDGRAVPARRRHRHHRPHPGLRTREPLVFVTHPGYPAKTLKDLVAQIKANPGKVFFGSSGAGAPQRMASEMLKTQYQLNTANIVYRGSGPAITDLMGGQLQFMAETVPAVLSFIRGGKLTAMAVASDKRDPNLPDVPTTAEAGFPSLEVSSTFGVLAPAGTPADVVQRLNTEIYKSLQKPEVQAQLAQLGVVLQPPLTPAAAQERLKAEVAKWAKVIADANIKADE